MCVYKPDQMNCFCVFSFCSNSRFSTAVHQFHLIKQQHDRK